MTDAEILAEIVPTVPFAFSLLVNAKHLHTATTIDLFAPQVAMSVNTVEAIAFVDQ